MAYTPSLRDRVPALAPVLVLRKLVTVTIADASFNQANRYFISGKLLGEPERDPPATGDASEQHTSLCDEQTATPVFANSVLQWDLPVHDGMAPSLLLTAYAVDDVDRGQGPRPGKGKVVGVCQISLASLLSRDADADEVVEPVAAVFQPSSGARTRVGECSCVLTLRDASLGAPRILRVGVRAAINLPLGDGGFGPAATVALKSMRDAASRRAAPAQTRPASKGRHPAWNEALALTFYEEDITRGERLLVAVVDDEQKQLIGRCSVPLRALEAWRHYELDLPIGKGDARLFLNVMLEGPPAQPEIPFSADPKLAMLQVAVEGFEATVAGTAAEAVAAVHLVPDSALYEVEIKQSLSSGKGAPNLPAQRISDTADGGAWARLNEEPGTRQATEPAPSLSGRRSHPFLFFPPADQLRLERAAAIVELYTRGGASGFPPVAGGRTLNDLTPPYTLHGYVIAPLGPLLSAGSSAAGRPSVALELRDLPLHVLSTEAPSFAVESVPATSLRIRARLWTYQPPATALQPRAPTSTAPPQGPPPLLDIDQLLALARPPIYTPPPPPPPALMENRATDAPVDLPPTPERSVLVEELRSKQTLVERLLREGDIVRQAVRKCGAEIVELRRQIAALQGENTELKRTLASTKADAEHQKRLGDLRATDATDLDTLDRDALLARCRAAIERLTLERGRSEDLAAHLARAKQDAWAKGELEKRYAELSAAHQAQAAYIQRLQGEMEKVEKFKSTIRNQEKVIEKLEQVMEQHLQQATQVPQPLAQREVIASKGLMHDSVLQDDGERDREWESQRVALVMRAEKAETRLAAVENQMADNARRFGKEISVLKMRLAEKEAALAGGFGSLSKMALDEMPAALKAPSLPQTPQQVLRSSGSFRRAGLEPLGRPDQKL
eukprot:tig00021534_g22244.t1